MKTKLNKLNKNIIVVILSTIAVVVFSTICNMILYNHGVPNIDYQSFLGEDYYLYLLFGVLMLVSFLSFIVSTFNLVKDSIKALKKWNKDWNELKKWNEERNHQQIQEEE